MPWKQASPETEQTRFVERCQAGGVTFVEVCRQFGISPKTGYKRIQRFKLSFKLRGWEGLPVSKGRHTNRRGLAPLNPYNRRSRGITMPIVRDRKINTVPFTTRAILGLASPDR